MILPNCYHHAVFTDACARSIEHRMAALVAVITIVYGIYLWRKERRQ